jgi:hypothetical protein
MGALTYAKVVATASVATVDCNAKAVPATTKNVAPEANVNVVPRST